MTATFRPVENSDIPALIALWQACDLTRPWNPPEKDIADLRAHPTAEILLMCDDGGAAIASVAVGYDGHRGWVYYVATAPGRQNRGLGRSAMQAAESWLRDRGIDKIQLMVRESNGRVIGFYTALGYVDSGVRVLQKWLNPERERLYREGHHAP